MHQNFKIDKFGDFSWDIDYNSRTDVFRDVISLKDTAREKSIGLAYSIYQE